MRKTVLCQNYSNRLTFTPLFQKRIGGRFGGQCGLRSPGALLIPILLSCLARLFLFIALYFRINRLAATIKSLETYRVAQK